MSGSVLLAVEAMTLGVGRMRDHAARHGCELVVLAEDPTMYVDAGPTRVLRFPTGDRAALETYVAENARNLVNVFSATDTWGVAAAELRERFGFPSRFPAARLSRFRDKRWVQRQLGVAERENDYPRVVKPRGGTGSTRITLVRDEREHRELLAGLDDPGGYFAQPYHRGPLYSAEIWANGSETAFLGVTNRITTEPPVFLERVKTFPHEHGTPWEAEVGDWARGLVGRLDYDLGFAHIEFIETAGGFELVEINARMAGALITPAVDHCTNYDPYAMVIADALCAEVELPASRLVTGGHSHLSVYAHRTGTFTSVEGVGLLADYPGDVGWLPAKGPGAAITDLTSHRARIGNVFATASTPALAQDRVLAASQAVRVHIG